MVREYSAGGLVFDDKGRVAIIARHSRSGHLEWCLPKGRDVYSSSSGSSGFWAWSSAAWASMRARSAGVIMIPTILNSVCRWGNGMLVNGKLVVLKGMA